MDDNKPTLDDLRELENRKGVTFEDNKKPKSEPKAVNMNTTQNIEDMLSNYESFDKEELPHRHLYLDNWEFFFRQPTTDEVSIFSTIPENDYFKIMLATINLIRKCTIILDVDTNQQISTERIKSCHKMFIFLKLRNMYMCDFKTKEPAQIKLPIFSVEIEEAIEIAFDEYSLIYDELSDETLALLTEDKSGFMFTEEYGAVGDTFIPIIDFGMETKIINFITNSYKKMQKAETKKKDFDNFDKKFLAYVPYLFDSPNDSIESLKSKYARIIKDENTHQFYHEMVTNLKLGEKDEIKYIVEREGEQILGETHMKFPNGYNGLFTRETIKSKLFR